MMIEQQLRRAARWVLSLLVAGPFALLGATAPPVGIDLYRKQCASCHGKEGEGVKKKYKEPLVGDWPVDKLARYIHRTMPDDKPKSLSNEQSEAVARYIYDAFYSREAQARKNPPRIELVRLTNPQSPNPVADVWRLFGRGEGPMGRGRGLGVSYGSGGKKGGGERKSSPRVAPPVKRFALPPVILASTPI